MRLLSAQMQAYLDGDLWLRNARHANAMARRPAAGMEGLPGVALQGRADANILFCRPPAAAIDSLLAQGFGFYHDRWGPHRAPGHFIRHARTGRGSLSIGAARRRGARMTLPA